MRKNFCNQGGKTLKTRLIIFVFSFALCILICFLSFGFVENSMTDILKEARNTETLLNENKNNEAILSTEKLNDLIYQSSKTLEALVPHEDLHDLSIQIADALISIRIGDMDDCKKAIVLIKENAEHLIRHEALSLGNIF